ncbi:SusC/RagA family TonB-linked outer membrane protein [Segetibacter koreensis]|uniref:SusC/RagA family TonB-linked outer membrane protein n=1 Tax=Segetibacter koreensis TaxID=398037 RepID=UPI0003645735|nr:TonB-dependent receptor [Segetibacter koreensis]
MHLPGKLLLAFISLFLITFANAQTKKITGKVTGPDTSPLEGVTVKDKGSSLSTITSADGTFSINVPDKVKTLVFSYISMETQEVPVSGKTDIQVQLKAASTSLSDVLVIGYGTARKRDITGAVASVKGDELKNGTAADASALLQGKAAGVVVQNSGGSPGQAPAIVIRGSGTFGNDQPLYVIDGMIASSMAFINPNDIASIEVLKDASAAAIYGSRAANGVVLVTTKSGTSGDIKINFSAKYGSQSPTHKLKFLNARQYADWNNQAHDNDGTPRGPLNDSLFNPNINTDWQSLSLGTAPLSDYNLSVSGGGQYSKFFVSGEYFDQKGIVVDSWFKRYALRANSFFTKGKFKFTEALSISRSVNNPNTYFGRERAELPIMPVYDSTKLGGFAGLEPAAAGVNRIINWYGRALLDDNRYTTDQALGNVGLEYEIIKGLKYKLNMGVDYSVYHAYDYSPAFFMSTSQEASQDQSILNESFTRSLTTLVEHTLNYSKAISDHRIDILAGYTYQKGNSRSVGATADTYPSDLLRVVNAAANRLASGSLQEAALMSILGRVSYSYQSKYLLTATLRRDGSSKFRYPTNTFGNYPSFSLGWRASEESFFPKNGIISDLKIRGSYGRLGSQNIANYITTSTLNINAGYYFAGGVQNGVGLTNFANPDIKWESSRTTDIGTDISLLKNKVLITADYFDRSSYDILASIPIPIYGGAGSSLTKNAASVNNKGFEVAVTYNHQPVSKNAFKYSLTGVFTTIKNNVTSLGDGVSPIIGGGFTQESLTATRTDVGHPIGSFWGYQVLGIYQNADEVTKDGRTDARPGDFRFSKDPTWLGSPFPKFDYGLTFNASYKNFDLNLFFQGVAGNKIWDAKRAWQYTFDYGSGKVTDVLRAWTPQNTNTDIARASFIDPANNKRSSSFYVEDGSYLRLKNINIGYNLPESVITKLKISNARLYVSGQNLLTFTKYKGYDPEVGRSDLTGLFSVGVDVSAYPQAKLISAGIDLSF